MRKIIGHADLDWAIEKKWLTPEQATTLWNRLAPLDPPDVALPLRPIPTKRNPFVSGGLWLTLSALLFLLPEVWRSWNLWGLLISSGVYLLLGLTVVQSAKKKWPDLSQASLLFTWTVLPVFFSALAVWSGVGAPVWDWGSSSTHDFRSPVALAVLWGLWFSRDRHSLLQTRVLGLWWVVTGLAIALDLQSVWGGPTEWVCRLGLLGSGLVLLRAAWYLDSPFGETSRVSIGFHEVGLLACVGAWFSFNPGWNVPTALFLGSSVLSLLWGVLLRRRVGAALFGLSLAWLCWYALHSMLTSSVLEYTLNVFVGLLFIWAGLWWPHWEIQWRRNAMKMVSNRWRRELVMRQKH
jgi:hypothetical protein